MDIEEQRIGEAVHTSTPVSQPTPMPVWPSASARPVMPVYSVEDRLRQRRLRAFALRVGMLALDAVMINVAFVAAYYLRYVVLKDVQLTTPFVDQPLSAFRLPQTVITIGMLAVFSLRGLYRLRPAGSWFKQFWVIGSATTTAFAIFSAYDYLVKGTDIALDNHNRSVVIFGWIGIIVIVSLARLLVDGVLSFLHSRGIGLTNLLVVGSGRLGKLMMQQIAATPALGYRVVGFVHDQDGPPSDFGRFKVLGTMSELDSIIRGENIAEVVIALPSHQHQQILRTVRLCERAGADFKLVPDLYELSLSRIDVDAIEGIPLIGLKRTLTSSWQYRIKRLIDILIAGAVLIIGAPIWLLIALAIKLDSPGPVLHKQTRLSYRGEPFECYKFRSMYMNADQMLVAIRAALPGDERGKFKLKNDPRRTRMGRFIRRTSLDEIPQFINVLQGKMSVIGPRPPLPVEYERYEDWEKARLEMPPGITGLWQVRGRSDIDFNEMVLMDLYYIENWSLRLDLQIMLQTIPAVLGSRGAY
jgi:exopolysaccharide biosynthesis polyprenyl glycosylphosphotransferase